MNKKYGIGFFISAIAAVMILSGSFQLSYYKAKQQAEISDSTKENKQQQADRSEEDLVAAEGTALKEDCYYLMEVNGYIVVYLSDKQTPYEYTDILYDELPAVLREEIRNGKYLENTEELYGFLENYSS